MISAADVIPSGEDLPEDWTWRDEALFLWSVAMIVVGVMGLAFVDELVR